MAAVMQKAASLDEAAVNQQQQKLSQLKTENETLRKLLKQSLLQLRELEGVDEGTQTGLLTSRDSTSSVESENMDKTVICASSKSEETSPKPSSQEANKSEESSPGKSEKSPENVDGTPEKQENGDSDSVNDAEFDSGTIKKSTIKKKPKPKSKTTPSKK